jgi:Glycosyltransferase family 87
VLVPFVLLAQRRWRALGAFSVVAVALAAAGTALGGLHAYRDWYDALRSPLYAEQVQVGQAWKMQSLPALLESLTGVGLAGPVLLAAGLATLVWRLRKGDTDIAHAWTMLTLVTVVTSPHVVLYDLVLLLPCLAWLLSHVEWSAVRGPLVALFGLQWLTPVLHASAGALGPAGSILEAPWSALPLTLLTVRTLRWRPPARSVPDSSDRSAAGATPDAAVARHA